MTIKILFHSQDKVNHCSDGFASAYVAWTVYGNNAEYIPVCYGDTLPSGFKKDDKVFILDFSYDRQTIINLESQVKQLVILDHHKTAQENLLGLNCALFDMHKSGAQLTWTYFYGDQPEPKIISYVADRDLWKHELPNTEEINLALSKIIPQDFIMWNLLDHMEEFVLFMSKLGAYELKKKHQAIKKIVERAVITEFIKEKVPTVELTEDEIWLRSDVGNELCKRYTNASFSICNYLNKTNSEKVFSLRSIGEFNVAIIAQKFGGGGHKNAAGFSTKI